MNFYSLSRSVSILIFFICGSTFLLDTFLLINSTRNLLDEFSYIEIFKAIAPDSSSIFNLFSARIMSALIVYYSFKNCTKTSSSQTIICEGLFLSYQILFCATLSPCYENIAQVINYDFSGNEECIQLRSNSWSPIFFRALIDTFYQNYIFFFVMLIVYWFRVFINSHNENN